MSIEQAKANYEAAKSCLRAAMRSYKLAQKIHFELLTAGLLPPKTFKRTNKK